MKIIIGLGNPGLKYENTRHNAGFKVIDAISEKTGIPVEREKFSSRFGKGKYKGEDLILIKPETYMNLSGLALRQVLDFYKVGMEDVIVIYDDIDLPVGDIRLRQKGSAGGHKGVKSIIECTFTSDFDRIRVGVGKDSQIQIIDWVLSKFREDEQEDLQEAVKNAANAALSAVVSGFGTAMNRYNKKKKKKPAAQADGENIETGNSTVSQKD